MVVLAIGIMLIESAASMAELILIPASSAIQNSAETLEELIVLLFMSVLEVFANVIISLCIVALSSLI